ncbi:MAG: phosphatase PAP2 family protein, partial [Acidimicrobiales bacterium]
AVALTFAGAVAASRVHLRAHHLSDVLAGALIGSVTGVAVRRVVDARLGAPTTALGDFPARRHGDGTAGARPRPEYAGASGS